MLLYIGLPIVYLLYFFSKNKSIHKLRFLTFCLTLFVSCFLYDTRVFGQRVYFVLQIVSLFLSLFDNKRCPKRQSSLFLFSSSILVGVMLLQMVNLLFGANAHPSLLIYVSNTDVTNIMSQIFTPRLDSTVIKHFLFFIVFILFVYSNRDFLCDDYYKAKITHIFKYGFACLFSIILLQFFAQNVIGISYTVTQDFFDLTLGITPKIYQVGALFSSNAWLPEPSSTGIYILFYLIILRQTQISRKDFFFEFLGLICAFLSTSTTTIATAGIFGLLFILRCLFDKSYCGDNVLRHIFLPLTFAAVLLVAVLFSDTFVYKIVTFVTGSGSSLSASWRKQSILLALQVFLKTPLIGNGIGTVFAHSMMVQVISNIGLIGLISSLLLNLAFVKNNSKFSWVLFLLTLGVFSASGTLQQYSSPYFLASVMFCFFEYDSSGFKQAVVKLCAFEAFSLKSQSTISL